MTNPAPGEPHVWPPTTKTGDQKRDREAVAIFVAGRLMDTIFQSDTTFYMVPQLITATKVFAEVFPNTPTEFLRWALDMEFHSDGVMPKKALIYPVRQGNAYARELVFLEREGPTFYYQIKTGEKVLLTFGFERD
jgi:hypothetical protein